jgi:uncharacterized protein YdaU (DUF1376 family)
MTSNHHWMPIRIGDYHRETRHLTAEQHGGYLLLGMEYWTKGSLPDDDDQLARIAGMSKAQWRRNRPTLQALFADGWKHPRLDAEIERAAKVSERYAERARKGADKRWGRRSDSDASSMPEASSKDASSIATEVPDESQPQPQPHESSLRSESREDASPCSAPRAVNRPTKSNRGSRLQPDWKPDESVVAWCVSADQGLTPAQVDAALAEFHDFWQSAPKNATKLDWNATFRNRIRDLIAKRRFCGTGKSNGTATNRGSVLDGLDKLDEAIAAGFILPPRPV